MDFIRPMLMPVLTVLIVSTIWCLGWLKQMEAESNRASLPTARALYVAQADDLDEIEHP
jgi:hypothetical protein